MFDAAKVGSLTLSSLYDRGCSSKRDMPLAVFLRAGSLCLAQRRAYRITRITGVPLLSNQYGSCTGRKACELKGSTRNAADKVFSIPYFSYLYDLTMFRSFCRSRRWTCISTHTRCPMWPFEVPSYLFTKPNRHRTQYPLYYNLFASFILQKRMGK